MNVIQCSFVNYITCYVAYFRLIQINFFECVILCSLWVYLMLCNKFDLLYSWLYSNIMNCYVTCYITNCVGDNQVSFRTIQPSCSNTKSVIYLLIMFYYNILWDILCRFYQYMYIATMQSYTICSILNYNWLYNNEYNMKYQPLQFTYITCYITCYITHNLVLSYTCYILGYITILM